MKYKCYYHLILLWGNCLIIYSASPQTFPAPHTISDQQGNVSSSEYSSIMDFELFEPIQPIPSRRYNKKKSNPRVNTSRRLRKRLERYMKKRQSGIMDVNNLIGEELTINRDYPCREPQPRVIDVQRKIPSLIVPTCIVLHRCDDHTGCCPRSGHCRAKHTANVFRKFGVLSGDKIISVIERRFQNHTKCFCQFDNNVQPSRSKKRKDTPANESDDEDRCRCTPRFVKKYRKGKCRCVCPQELDCEDLWKGRAFFNDSDFKCIDSQKCEPPDCKFGSFMFNKRRCPTIDERFENKA